jgi:hypothetical protein
MKRSIENTAAVRKQFPLTAMLSTLLSRAYILPDSSVCVGEWPEPDLQSLHSLISIIFVKDAPDVSLSPVSLHNWRLATNRLQEQQAYWFRGADSFLVSSPNTEGIPRMSCYAKVYYCVYKIPQLEPIPSQVSLIFRFTYIVTTYIIKSLLGLKRGFCLRCPSDTA